MSQHAKVRSIEAIDAFRTALLLYRDHASRILEELQTEIHRTRSWLEGDCLLRWRKLVHDRQALLEQAEAELLTARLSNHTSVIQEKRLIVNRARLAVRQAEEGIARVQHWKRHFATDIEARAKPALNFRQTLDSDVQQAIAWLKETVDILESYAAIPAPAATAAPTTPATTTPQPAP